MASLSSRFRAPALALLTCLVGCERASRAPSADQAAPAASAAQHVRPTKSEANGAAREVAAVVPASASGSPGQATDLAADANEPVQDAARKAAEERPEPRSPFRPLDLALDAARAALGAMPETRNFADAFRLHSPKHLLGALSNGGRSGQSLGPWQVATPAFGWSPLPDENLVILSGDAPAGAILVAYRSTADGPRFAGSFTTKDEHGPILVAYKSDAQDELLYSTCWGCGGEGGALRLDDARRLRFMPR